MADLTNQVLIEIRDEIRQTNVRLDRLERRQTESEIRLATELVAVVKEVRDAILEDRELRKTVLSHEGRIAALEAARSS